MKQTITPVPGRLIRDPVTGREISAPLEVDLSDPFWQRRLRDKDIALRTEFPSFGGVARSAGVEFPSPGGEAHSAGVVDSPAQQPIRKSAKKE